MAKAIRLPQQELTALRMVEIDIQSLFHRALYLLAMIDPPTPSCGRSPRKIFRTRLATSRLLEE
jgi:hypothetical protein